MVSGSFSLPCSGYFSPFPHGTCPLSVSGEYLALRGGPRGFRQDFSCPALLVASPVLLDGFRVRDYHPVSSSFPECSTISSHYLLQALPISLATTLGISVDFFSSSYWDVSVRPVRLPSLCIQLGISTKDGFPHSDTVGSTLYCQLPHAFRRLTRPSSPVFAKASTTSTWSLDPITHHPQNLSIRSWLQVFLNIQSSKKNFKTFSFNALKSPLLPNC